MIFMQPGILKIKLYILTVLPLNTDNLEAIFPLSEGRLTNVKVRTSNE